MLFRGGGQLPAYFQLWLESCGRNSTIDFFVFTDDKTYYAYLCDAKEQEITNLGKIYLEEDGDNLFLTITTKKFSDFLITEDNLKAVKTNNQVEKTNIPLIIGIISTAVVIIAAGTVLLIIFLKRRKIKKQ